MLFAYLRRERRIITLLSGVCILFAVVFFLYDLPVEPVCYAAVLSLALLLVLFTAGYCSFLRRHRCLQRLLQQAGEQVLPLPETSDPLEQDYQELVAELCADRVRLSRENRRCMDDMIDYYTIWAHQIKTPIAAAHLLIEQGASGAEVDVELLRIQQYADMVLGYLRLDSDDTDYVLRPVELDALLRQSVRKLARLFVLKKIRLSLEKTQLSVLSDEKWLGFVVEQVLSNALKYTPSGGKIRIYAEGETLIVADSGIGIRQEDLPRVFEKGFTGYNGRWENKSTGIGLYLCHRTMQRLNHTISIASQPGQGTAVRMSLGRQTLETE